MSLVSYGASDDSDSNDVEEQKVSNQINDDQEYSEVSSTSSKNVNNKSLYVQSKSSSNDFQKAAINFGLENLSALKDLPAPQTLPTETFSEESELEETVRPRAAELADAVKPPAKKTKQPVRITIPSLQNDEDEDNNSQKKLKPSSTKSGLFSLLPPPLHSAKKEMNRPLIPHSLTKKPPVVAKTAKPTPTVSSSSATQDKPTTHFQALTGYDSDSDEEEQTNFFSLSSDKTNNSLNKNRLQSEEISSSEISHTNEDSLYSITSKTKDDAAQVPKTVKDSPESSLEGSSGPEPGAVNDAPLDFQSVNKLNMWSSSSYGFLEPVGRSGPVSQSFSYSHNVPSNSQYNLANTGTDEASTDISGQFQGNTQSDAQNLLTDKEFLRLQGKRKRNSEEVINFVEANVDDYVDPSEIPKHFTEETEYVSHRKDKDNIPTGQQKRKKQITYLAHQAKEHELMLKNTWAQNRLTKKQTQSKYGF